MATHYLTITDYRSVGIGHGLRIAEGPSDYIDEPGSPWESVVAIDLPEGAILREGQAAPEIELPDGFRGFLMPTEHGGEWQIEVWGDPGHPMRRPNLSTAPA